MRAPKHTQLKRISNGWEVRNPETHDTIGFVEFSHESNLYEFRAIKKPLGLKNGNVVKDIDWFLKKINESREGTK